MWRGRLASTAGTRGLESSAALTGRFKFQKTVWGKVVLQVEDEVRLVWQFNLTRRWRDCRSPIQMSPLSPIEMSLMNAPPQRG